MSSSGRGTVISLPLIAADVKRTYECFHVGPVQKSVSQCCHEAISASAEDEREHGNQWRDEWYYFRSDQELPTNSKSKQRSAANAAEAVVKGEAWRTIDETVAEELDMLRHNEAVPCVSIDCIKKKAIGTEQKRRLVCDRRSITVWLLNTLKRCA